MQEAPRWRLINEHYLKVPELPDGTKVEWEHKETARETGRQVRKLYGVPLLLDPKSPADCNYPGDVIVAHEPSGDQINTNRNDYIFLGDPTPEMEPLNPAAQAITDRCRPRWENPIESLPANGGMNAQESAFMKNMMETFSKIAAPQVNTAVSREEYDALKAELEAMRAAMMKAAPVPEPVATRRV